ncbi:heterokaryon incompatibility protein-domain-containing protein [Leptodontidium sp. MPI-SDFR-AT-0119]|nr:heterokaryon incompatibility protein-domain-containing protein [Leptodontidium sp. MPI-SDFR-AT-0119]
MMNRIPDAAMSKTFEDTFTTARHLGFQYIWIDSLCILQGDKEDWQREAALMSSVYAGSSLNIVALDAPSGETGCFFQRDAQTIRGHKLLSCADAKSSDRTLYNCMPSGSFFRGPAFERAWIFQERLLSPRNLHLGKRELLWECRERLACETLPEISIINKYDEGPKIISRWNGIIREYSTGKLTYATDKLVAISGVARQFAGAYNLEYLAGVWREYLEHQLLWFILRRNRQILSERYRAPSWSWTPVDGAVSSHPPILSEGTRLYIAIQDAVVEPSNSDIFGQISGGCITLKCQGLLPVEFGDAGYSVPTISIGNSPRFLASLFLDSLGSEYKQLFCLKALYTKKPELWFLLLLPAGDGKFYRVGVFYIYDWGKVFSLDAAQTAEKSALEQKVLVDGEEPAGLDETGRQMYLITII